LDENLKPAGHYIFDEVHTRPITCVTEHD
jgi:hypothetical protein